MVSGEDLDKSGFSYIANSPELEEENYLLRQTVEQLNRDLERHKQFKEEIERFKKPALMVADVVEMINEHAVIRVVNGNKFLVTVTNDIEGLKAGDSVLVEQKNLTVVDKINSNKHFNVEQYVIMEDPDTDWSVIGGLEEQKIELREVIEVPLLQPEIFRKIGIQPPKGVLLHGPPGTGKTLMAKALATSSDATFIQIVGSELVQKFIGEGAKMVKEIFQLAREKAPSIVFIDELDSLAAKRIDMGTSGEREVQRTFMQLLAEIDGFKNLDNVKVIAATNRMDTLDPAVLRPGRLDRLVLIPNPCSDGIREIFRIHTKNMNVKKTNIDHLLKKMEGYSGAEIQAVCTEAGYFAMRKDRHYVVEEDFLKAIKKVKKDEEKKDLQMFG
jgi:proteasome regulatory subunit